MPVITVYRYCFRIIFVPQLCAFIRKPERMVAGLFRRAQETKPIFHDNGSTHVHDSEIQ